MAQYNILMMAENERKYSLKSEKIIYIRMDLALI